MGYKVSFSIEGSSASGVSALDALDKSLAKIGSSTAFKKLEGDAVSLWARIGSVNNALKDMRSNLISLTDHQGFKSLTDGLSGARASALATARAVRTMAEALDRVSTKSIRGMASGVAQVQTSTNQAAISAQRLARAQQQTSNATNQAALSAARLANYQAGIAAKTQQAAAATSGWALGLRAVEATAGRLLMTFGRVVAATGSIAKGVSIPLSRLGVQGAGPIQSMGIATRMWGINFGNQLSTAGSGGPLGIAKMIPGVLASVAELGVRIASAMAGFGIKAGGLLVQGLVNTIGGVGGALLKGVLGSFGGLIGRGFAGILSAAGNILTAVTNLAGEAVTQVGNVFTGLAEAARGALQGMLNAAGEIFGSLYNIAERVVGKIAGVLGTVGKMVLGTGAVIGGFAARDVMGTEKGLSRGLVLVDDKMTPAQTNSMKSWVHDMAQKFGEFSREQIGNAWARVVGTGFSDKPEQAKKIAESALKLSYASGYPEEAESAARVLAKSLSIFGDEFKNSDEQADAFFQTISQGDLSLGGLTENLSHTMAAAKAMGVSLKELLVLIAQMSMTAGQEETSTGLRRLLLEPLKFTDKGLDLLKSKGIDTNAYLGGTSPETEAIQAKIDEAHKRLDRLGDTKQDTKDSRARAAIRKADIAEEIKLLTIKERGLKGPTKQTVKRQIDQLQLESMELNKGLLGLDKGEGAAKLRAQIKGLTAELKEAAAAAGDVKNLPELLEKIAHAGLTPQQLREVFPDLRALSAALILRGQNPELAGKIRGHIVNAAGSVDQGAGIQSERMGNKWERLWTAIKSPFEASINAIETRLNSFLEWAIAGFERLGKWWGQALAAPGAQTFLDNIVGKLKGLFGFVETKKGLFEGLFDKDGSKAQGIEKFWNAMNSGLDTAWNFAGKVVTGFETLYGWIVKIAEKTGADTFLGTIGQGIGSAASWVGGTAGQLGEGSTDNLDALVKKIEDVWASVWGKGKELFAYGAGLLDSSWTKAKAFWDDDVVPRIESWFSTAETLAKISAGAAAVGAMLNLARFFGGGKGGSPGGGPGGGGAAGWDGGGVDAIATSFGARFGAGVLKGLRAIYSGFLAYEVTGVVTKTLGGSDAQASGAGGIAGGAVTGGMIGGPWGALIGAVWGAGKMIVDAMHSAGPLKPDVAKYDDMTVAEMETEFRKLKDSTVPGATQALAKLNGVMSVLAQQRDGRVTNQFKALQKTISDEINRRMAAAQAPRDAERDRAGGARVWGDGYPLGGGISQGVVRSRASGAAGLGAAGRYAVDLTPTSPTLAALVGGNPDRLRRTLPWGSAAITPRLNQTIFQEPLRPFLGLGKMRDDTRNRMLDAINPAGGYYTPGTQSSATHGYAGSALLKKPGWYDDGSGSLRGPRSMHTSPFGLDSGPGWKKLRRAEQDPMFEGGRWERFTSRGVAAEEARRASLPSVTDAKKSADETLEGTDPKKATEVVGDTASAITSLKQVLETLISGGTKNNEDLIRLVKDALEKLDGADDAQSRAYDDLKGIVDALGSAKTAAGVGGGAAGGTL